MVTTIQTLQGTGVVRIESNPSEGNVYIDGEFYGKSPVTVKDVEIGQHVYVIQVPEYPEYHGAVNVRPGELCSARYNFTNYELEEDCPPIQLSGIGNNNGNNNNITGMGIQTLSNIRALQEPTPTPGYVTINQNTIIWVLVGSLVTILLIDYLKKRL
jgi:hypothetical protein